MQSIDQLVQRLDRVTIKPVSLDAKRNAIKRSFKRHNERVEEGKEEWAVDVFSDRVYFRDNEGNTSSIAYEIYF